MADTRTHAQRQQDFDDQVEDYLERLTKISSMDDLLQVVRDGATWALAEHRADRARKKGS